MGHKTSCRECPPAASQCYGMPSAHQQRIPQPGSEHRPERGCKLPAHERGSRGHCCGGPAAVGPDRQKEQPSFRPDDTVLHFCPYLTQGIRATERTGPLSQLF